MEQGIANYAPPQQVERPVFDSGEHFEQRSEQLTTTASTPDPDAVAAPIPPPSPEAQAPTTTSAPETAAPTTAKDGDLIEREWVQKAKQILTETHEDPHARSDRIQALQAAYLFERYNRKIGDVA